MKYKVGEYLGHNSSVLLRIVVALEGDIYALSSIKTPMELDWFTLPELEHEELKPVKYNPDEFKNVRVGDTVQTAKDEYTQVLAIAGRGVLLSKGNNSMAKSFMGLIDTLEESGANITVPKGLRKHMETHASTKYTFQAAGNWVDIDTMALMNWKLVKE